MVVVARPVRGNSRKIHTFFCHKLESLCYKSADCVSPKRFNSSHNISPLVALSVKYTSQNDLTFFRHAASLTIFGYPTFLEKNPK